MTLRSASLAVLMLLLLAACSRGDEVEIATQNLPEAYLGVAYSTELRAKGGRGDLNWELTSPAPPGLQLRSHGERATLEGTPTLAGDYSLDVRVTDEHSNSAERSFFLRVSSASTPMSIVTATLAATPLSMPYSQNVTATGGSGGYAWSVLSGTLPPGLVLSASGTPSTTISGTPTAVGNYSFTLQVTDSSSNAATRPLAINVTGSFAITTLSLPDGTTSVAYSGVVTAAGGASSFVWSISAGALPPGLTLQSVGTPSTLINGTPTAPGSYNFTIHVMDSASNTAQRAFTIDIDAALVITTAALPGGQISAAYSAPVSASGGSGAGYAWSVQAGALPPGLGVAPSGTPSTSISGTPTMAGTFNFTLRVEDSLGVTADAPLSIVVATNLTFAPATLTAPVFGAPYSQALTGSGGLSPYTWSVTLGGLPPGLSLSASGTPASSITGTPTALGTWNFTVRLTDAGASFFERGYSVTVDPGAALTITVTTLPEAIVGQPYAAVVSASGGSASGYTWSIVGGSLDASFSLNVAGTPQTGISGTATSTAATSTFTLQVQDSSANTATQAFTLTVRDPLIITTTSLADGDTTAAYAQTISASGGTTAGYAWSIVSGSLPPGLSLGASGTPSTLISGTPTLAGTYIFTIGLTDSGSYIAQKALSIFVVGPGLVSTVAGNGVSSYPPDGTLATQAGIGSPRKVVFRANGDMYIVQSGWNIVSRVDAADGKIYRVAGNTYSGSAGDNGPATLAQLNAPMSVAFEAGGDMFIADSGNHSIRRVSAINGFITTFMTGFTGPYDIVFDTAGRLVVCDGDRVKRIDLLTLAVTTIAGGGAGYSGDGGPATAAGIGSASAIVFDASGNYYFTDQFYHTVRRVSAAGVITTVAGTGSIGTSSDGIPAVSASLRWPSGVALAANGDLLICDTNSHRIRRVDLSTGLISTFAGNPAYAGSAGIFGGDGGQATNADFNNPQGVTVGIDGHIYVCDVGNNRIRRIRQ